MRSLSNAVGVYPMNRAARVLTALISVLKMKNRSFALWCQGLVQSGFFDLEGEPRTGL